MNVFDLGSSTEEGDDENKIQKEWAKMLTVKDLLCLIIDFMEIFQNSDLCRKEATPPADVPASTHWLQHKPALYV